MRTTHAVFLLTITQLLSLSCVQDVPTTEPPPVGRPVVTILSPANNAVIVDSAIIEVEAFDDRTVERVEIYVDYRVDSSRILTAAPYRWRWDVQSLLDSSLHRIYARAYDDEGNAANSSLLIVTVRVSNPPVAPSGLDILSMRPSGPLLDVSLQWQDNSSSETGFDIMVSTDDGLNYVTAGTTAADVTQTTLRGSFSPAAIYLFRVRARSGSNVSTLSNGVRARYFTELYAGGTFATAGGVPANNIARWDGTAWSDVGGGTNGAVLAFGLFAEDLYTGGQFTSAGGVPGSCVARWNGRFWSDAGGGTNNAVYALSRFTRLLLPPVLFAGGVFVMAGGRSANRVAVWDGTAWSPVGMGMGDIPASPVRERENGSLVGVSVNAFAVLNFGLYAGGRFGTADGVPVNNVARAGGSGWESLGAGTNGAVHGLASYSGRLYAGGEFDTAGGVAAQHLAEWVGSSWRGMGTGTNGTVRVVFTFGGIPYAGGDFTMAGGTTTNHVARLTGGDWTSVGGGTDGPVYAFAEYGGALYAGGDFTAAGGAGASHVARWDGISWSAVGAGVNGVVRAIATYGFWSWNTVP